MNKIYKTVWSEKKGTYVAVSEIVTNRGKEAGGSEEAFTSKPSGRLKTLASILLSIGFVSGLASQTVAQEVTTEDIDTLGGSIADFLGTGASYNSRSFTFTVPTNIGGTGEDNVFKAIGKVQGDLTSLTGRVTTTEDRVGTAETSINNLTTNLKTANANISNNATAISNNTAAITGLTGRVYTAEGNITQLQTNLAAANTAHDDLLTALGTTAVAAEYNGIKYFRVNSIKADANAEGERDCW